ncbi:MAG: hypothetical protein RL220_395 [Bacteroidota bacterium]
MQRDTLRTAAGLWDFTLPCSKQGDRPNHHEDRANSFGLMISVIDIVLFVVLGFTAWKGWKNGFVYEVIMFLALFAAIYISIHFSAWVGTLFGKATDGEGDSLPLVTFILTFVLVLVSAWLLAKVLSGLANNGSGEIMNRIGGGFFAVAKSVLILSFILILIAGTDDGYKLLSREQREKSFLLEPVYDLGTTIMPAIGKSEFYRDVQESGLIPGVESDSTSTAKKKN